MLIMALALNRSEFVRTLLNHGVSLHSLLTNEVLQFLYGYRSHTPTSTLKYEFNTNDYINAGESSGNRIIYDIKKGIRMVFERLVFRPRPEMQFGPTTHLKTGSIYSLSRIETLLFY